MHILSSIEKARQTGQTFEHEQCHDRGIKNIDTRMHTIG